MTVVDSVLLCCLDSFSIPSQFLIFRKIKPCCFLCKNCIILKIKIVDSVFYATFPQIGHSLPISHMEFSFIYQKALTIYKIKLTNV